MSSDSMQPADGTIQAMREAILEAMPDAGVFITAGSPGHFEIKVIAGIFEGKSRVRQQQLVYGAIAHLMKGDGAPVHAIDRLLTRLPVESSS